MKKITLFLILSAFCINVYAKDNLPGLSEVKNLASIDRINISAEIDKNTDKLNSVSMLNSLSFKKNLTDTKKPKPKKFSFSIIPYGWFSAVGGTVGYDSLNNYYAFNKSFSDAVKNLKMAAAVMGKFKYERVSFVYDISYVNLKGFGTEFPTGQGIVSSNWTIKQTLYDLFLSYLFPSKSKKTMVDVYAGGRLWSLDVESTTMINDTLGKGGSDGLTVVQETKMSQFTNSWFDPVIGINAEFVLSKDMKWAAWSKGDIGGFGVNSQMTWQLNAGVAYMLSPNFPLGLGFKYVGVNHDKDARRWTVNEYGLTLSIGYRY